jgi:hypothetical protein
MPPPAVVQYGHVCIAGLGHALLLQVVAVEAAKASPPVDAPGWHCLALSVAIAIARSRLGCARRVDVMVPWFTSSAEIIPLSRKSSGFGAPHCHIASLHCVRSVVVVANVPGSEAYEIFAKHFRAEIWPAGPRARWR